MAVIQRVIENLRARALRERDRFSKSDRRSRLILAQRCVRKILFLVSWPFLLCAAVLLRLSLWALKPWVHIRFGRLWFFSLGAFTIPTEGYLCQRDAGLHPRRALDLFYHYDREGDLLDPRARRSALISNEYLDKMFRSKLLVWEGVRALYFLNGLLPLGSDAFVAKLTQPYNQDGLLDRLPAHLALSPEEEKRGREELRHMGADPDAPIVCFYARDGFFVSQARPRLVSLYGDWPHRSMDPRNASIQSSLLAAQRLTELGYTAIRMGKFVEEPIQTDNPRIIDYAWKYHSDFMDVFLSARCAFFIGQNSGMTSLPLIFRRPVAFVNVVPFTELHNSCAHGCIFIPKRYFSRAKGRLLTFREMMDLGVGSMWFKSPHERTLAQELGLEIQENTPEEILGVALEMHERFHSSFQPSQEDEHLQQRLLQLLRFYPETILLRKVGRHVRMGTHFLREHRELLEDAQKCLLS